MARPEDRLISGRAEQRRAEQGMSSDRATATNDLTTAPASSFLFCSVLSSWLLSTLSNLSACEQTLSSPARIHPWTAASPPASRCRFLC